MAEQLHRVLRQRKKGWRMPDHTKDVSRSSRWGNRVSEPAVYGDAEAHRTAIEEYRRWAFAPEQAAWRESVRQGLRGWNLACYCKPGLACHADVLLEIANGEEDSRELPADPSAG